MVEKSMTKETALEILKQVCEQALQRGLIADLQSAVNLDNALKKLAETEPLTTQQNE